VFLAKLDRRLRQSGFGGIDIDAQFTARNPKSGSSVQIDDLARSSSHDAPQLYEQVRGAVRDANDILGDFANMPNWQRRYMRQIYPFWSWTRHVYQLAMRLPVDDPIRVAWIMRIGDYVASDEELPEWMRASIPVAGGRMDIGFANPLSDVAGLPFVPGGGDYAKQILSPTAPLLKLGAAALFGQDWNKGGQPISRPRGSGRVGSDATPVASPLLFDPSAMLYRAITAVPQGRALLNVLPGGHTVPGTRIPTGPVIRYGTGDPILGAGRKPLQSEDPGWTRIYPALGLPTYMSDDRIEQWRKTVARRRRLLAASQR
jgi:hypothetical protein